MQLYVENRLVKSEMHAILHNFDRPFRSIYSLMSLAIDSIVPGAILSMLLLIHSHKPAKADTPLIESVVLFSVLLEPRLMWALVGYCEHHFDEVSLS